MLEGVKEDDKAYTITSGKVSEGDDPPIFKPSVLSTGDVANKPPIRASNLTSAWSWRTSFMKTNLQATIMLEPADLATAFMQSPAAKFEGSLAPKMTTLGIYGHEVE